MFETFMLKYHKIISFSKKEFILSLIKEETRRH